MAAGGMGRRGTRAQQRRSEHGGPRSWGAQTARLAEQACSCALTARHACVWAQPGGLCAEHACTQAAGARTRHQAQLTRHSAAGGALLAAQEHDAGGGVAVQQRVHALAAVAQHVVVDVPARARHARACVCVCFCAAQAIPHGQSRQGANPSECPPWAGTASWLRMSCTPDPPGLPPRRSSPAKHRLKRLGQEAALDDQPLRAVQRAAGAQLRQQELLRGWGAQHGALRRRKERPRPDSVADGRRMLHRGMPAASSHPASDSRGAARCTPLHAGWGRPQKGLHRPSRPRPRASPARAPGCGSSTCKAP